MPRLAALLLAVLVAGPAQGQGPSLDACTSGATAEPTHEAGPLLDRHRRAVARLDARHDAAQEAPRSSCLDGRSALFASTTTEIRQAWVVGTGWDDRTRLSRTFDDAGRRVKEVVATRTEGDWEPVRRTVSAFPGDDLVLTFETWTDGAWLPATRSSFFYRSDQRSTGARAETWVAVTGHWRVDDQTTIAYDAEGRQTAVTIESWDGTALTPVQRSLSDRTGTVTTVLSQTWTGAAWRDAARTTFTDTVDGSPLARLDEVRSAGAWANDARTLYTYGDPVEVRTQEWAGGDWSNVARTLVVTDGATETRTTETWAEAAWVGLDRTASTRDAEGRLTQSVTSVWDGEAYVDSRRLRREYTGATLTSESHDRWDPPSDGWWVVSMTRITLGVDGRPAESEALTYSVAGRIATGTRTAHAYDALGRLMSQTREAYDGPSETWAYETRTLFIDDGPVDRAPDPEGRLVVSVRPNPVVGAGVVWVESRGLVRVDVFDVLGRHVAVLADGPLASPSIRLPPLTPGTYVVRLARGEEAVTETITIVR